MVRRLTITKQGLIGICLLLAVEFLFIGTLAGLLFKTKTLLDKEQHDRDVAEGLNNVANISQKIGIAMIRSASPPELLQFVESSTDYHGFMGKLNHEITRLKDLVRDDPDSLKKLDELESAAFATCRYYDSQQASFRQTPAGFETFNKTMFRLSANVTRLSQELIKRYRNSEQTKPSDTSRALSEAQLLLIATAVVNLLGAILVAMILVKRITGRISTLTENVERFANEEPLLERIPDTDEIGMIDSLFHEMTSALELARRNETALIQNASELICQLDAEGMFISLSPSVKTQWGYEPEQLLGTHFSTVLRSKDVTKCTAAVKQLMSTGERSSFETFVKTSSRQYISTMWSAYWSAQAESLFCFVHNITDLKNMEAVRIAQEEQVRTATENIPVGLITMNADGFIQSVNATTEKLAGRLRLDLNNRPVLSLLESGDRMGEDLLHTFDTANSTQAIRCLLKRPDGRNIPVDITSVHFGAQSNHERLLVLDDVSERVRLETMKEDFVNILGRNLREPLNATRISVSTLLQTTDVQSKKHDRLSRVCTNIERLLRLIDELLSIQKLGAGRLVGTLKPVKVREVMRGAVEAISDHAEQQGISIECGEATGTILGDSERLVQVIVNLTGNAIKFSPRNSTVSLQVESDDEQIVFSIIDRGRGVPKEMRSSIFEQYVQTSTADGRRGKGTGLGLSICKSIVEAHGGTIGVDSEEGSGSRFWFSVPRLAEHRASETLS